MVESLQSLENALERHKKNRSATGKVNLIPMDIYDILDEKLPRSIVNRIGEIIMNTKGVS